MEAGPVVLSEDQNGTTSRAYRVRLAAAPTATVTVTVASADIDAVTVDDTDSVAGGVQSTLWMA